MRGPLRTVIHGVTFGLGLAGLLATAGCGARPEAGGVGAIEPARVGPEESLRERLDEVRCCERHFFFNGRLRAACLIEAGRHRGICAPPAPPPRDAGSGRDAAPRDAGTGDAVVTDAAGARDAAATDAAGARDAAATDAAGARDAAATDAVGAKDAGTPPGLDAAAADAGAKKDAAPADAATGPTCPTSLPLGAGREVISDHEAWGLNADLFGGIPGPGQTVTWTTTSFQLLATSGPQVDLECTGDGPATVTATLTGPGSCVLSQAISVTCSPFCGNGIVEPGEQCDPPDGLTCTSQCQNGPPATCGNGIVDPGETCDIPHSPYCLNCQMTPCYACFLATAAVNPSVMTNVCRTLQGTQETKCEALETCMIGDQRECDLSVGPLIDCFCSDTSCSAGPNKGCSSQLEAFLGTSDPAQIVAGASSSTVTQIALQVRAGEACNSFCATQPLPLP